MDGYTGVNWAWVRVVYMPEMQHIPLRLGQIWPTYCIVALSTYVFQAEFGLDFCRDKPPISSLGGERLWR